MRTIDEINELEEDMEKFERFFWKKLKNIVFESNRRFLRNMNDGFPYVDGFLEYSKDIQFFLLAQFEKGKPKVVLLENLEKDYQSYYRKVVRKLLRE